MQIILKTYYHVLYLIVHSEITLIGKYIKNYLPGYCNIEQNNENTLISTRFSVLSCVQPNRLCIDHFFILHFNMFSSQHWVIYISVNNMLCFCLQGCYINDFNIDKQWSHQAQLFSTFKQVLTVVYDIEIARGSMLKSMSNLPLIEETRAYIFFMLTV